MIVYALADPVTREIRYVGETIRPAARRLAQHARTADKQTTPPVNAWIRGLGRAPLMIEIESLECKEAMHDAEIYWIEQFRAMGAKLLNLAPGGSTRVGYRHTEETKAKWRRERRGENGSNFGKRHSEATKAASSVRVRAWLAENGHPMQGLTRSAETRKRISAGRKGITAIVPPEGLERIAAARARCWADPAYRAMMTRPGLANPCAKAVTVDGVQYAYAELARALGIHRNTATRRIHELAGIGRELTASDFASRKGQRAR